MNYRSKYLRKCHSLPDSWTSGQRGKERGEKGTGVTHALLQLDRWCVSLVHQWTLDSSLAICVLIWLSLGHFSHEWHLIRYTLVHICSVIVLLLSFHVQSGTHSFAFSVCAVIVKYCQRQKCPWYTWICSTCPCSSLSLSLSGSRAHSYSALSSQK